MPDGPSQPLIPRFRAAYTPGANDRARSRVLGRETAGMARGWKCARCSTENGEGTLNCSNCGLIRGGVVVPSAYTPPPVPTSPTRPPVPWSPTQSPGWASETDRVAAEAPSPVDPGVNAWVAPPTATPLWRRIPIGWLVVAVFVAAGGIGGLIFNASRSSSGEISRSGDMMATDLRVGDCFDVKDPAADEITDVTARPCTDEHEYELIFSGPMTDGDYPAEDAFTAFMKDNCVLAFDAYIGKAYADSELDIYWLIPLEEAWSAGDRSIQCAAYHPRIHRLTESLKGSNR